ncbi:PAPA-1 domain-containing protein [Mycena indigotica]|uniref:PAPA-1 domain-containing protein n=1 Tax=Mycena indigotica TaxID=2126181 RepID=A0A8H6WHF3_9AGAR|nr:PAPA-1 domain-containing protein [Mycena indigotica]KAF7312414.1 PAPA-1 domain-containing protein [Mycena indigotica]
MAVGRRLPSAASEESEVDIEVAEDAKETSEEEDEDEEELEPEDEEDASQDELEDDSEEEEEEQLPRPSLKIKLKLGAAPVPIPQPPRIKAPPARAPPTRAPPARAPPARAARRPALVDVESEDEQEDSDDDEVDDSMTGLASGRLTARQAALAGGSVTQNSPIAMALPEPPSRKRAASPSQVALRKEENARKRKNKIEKKLEDEKLETINRLLKKQSRPKGKRGPAPAAASVTAPATAAQSDEEKDRDVEIEQGDEEIPPNSPVEPSLPLFRWLSTSRAPPANGETTNMEVDSNPSMSILFCVPEALLPPSSPPALPRPSSTANSQCAVAGCSQERKYRAVGREWGVGACGILHLKLLETKV